MRPLIVDDSRAFLEAARMLLEREGVSVVGVATTSAEALEQARALHPDVILVDVFLGQESGLELVRRLTEDSRSEEATVILISSHSEADLAELIAGSPAAGFLPKTELSAPAIRRIVDSRAA